MPTDQCCHFSHPLLSAGVSGFVSGKQPLVASNLRPGTQSEFVSVSQPRVSSPRALLYDRGFLVRKQPPVVSILPPAPQTGFVGVPQTRVLSPLPSATQSVSPEGKRLVVITRTPVTSVSVSPQRAYTSVLVTGYPLWLLRFLRYFFSFELTSRE